MSSPARAHRLPPAARRKTATSQPATRPAPPVPAASLEAPTLITGDLAPDFTLQDAHGGSVTLSKLTAKKSVILIFYLGYTCPRCVEHIANLNQHDDEIQKLGGEIIAISPDKVDFTKDSIKEFGDFPFPMLSDPDHKVFADYTLLLKNDDLLYGTFVIDSQNKIRFIRRGDYPFDDPESVLEALRLIQDRKHH